MRNLKKVLSLSLALVMLIGMMVVGAGAATYQDVAAGSDQECAIEVMSAINVFTGTGDGFAPEKTLSRAEAAVIVARLVYTKATVDKMTAIGSTFADVQAQAPWAAGAIEACVNDHILDGDGEGNFNPTGEVTGYQFGKMLLMAIGYGDEGKYTGANWEYSVRQDLLAAGLDEGMAPSVLSNQPMKRADAAQMALDAATYSPSGYKWAVAGIPGVFDTAQDAMLYGYILTNGEGDLTPTKVPGSDSIAAQTYGLSVEADGEFSEDAYGRPALAWMLNNEPIYIDASTASIVLNKTYKTDGSNLPNALKAKNANYDNIVYVVNGEEVEIELGEDENPVATVTGNGKIVEVFMTGKNVNKLVVIAPELKAVTKVDTKNNAFTIDGGIKIDEDSDFIGLIDEVEVGDLLVYVGDGESVLELYVPETVAGTMTFRANNGVATIGGEKVTPCKGYSIDTELVKEDVVAYMINGYAALVVNAEGVKKSNSVGDGYIWITNLWTDKASYTNEEQVVKVMGVLADGTVKTLTLKNPSSAGAIEGTWVGMPEGTAAADEPEAGDAYVIDTDSVLGSIGGEGLYKYYAKTKGSSNVILVKVDETVKEGDDGGLSVTKPKIGIYSIDADVDIVWITGSGANLSGTVTGRNTIASGHDYTYVVDKTTNRVALIFVESSAMTSEDVIYSCGSEGRAYYVNAKGETVRGYQITYFAHGSDEELTAIVDENEAGFYTMAANGEGYALTEYAPHEHVYVEAEADEVYNGFLTIGSDIINIKNALIIDLRGEKNVVDTAKDLEELVSNEDLVTTVSVIMEPDGTAKTVYVISTDEVEAEEG